MNHHPLLTETSIPVSVTLAATIGLNEAVLLTVINQIALGQPIHHIRIRRDLLRHLLPFWDDQTIRQTLTALFEQGLLILRGPMYPESQELILAFSQHPLPQTTPLQEHPVQEHPLQEHSAHQQAATAPHTPAASTPPPDTAPPAAPASQWQPSDDTLQRLQQHGIPAAFARAQRDVFLLQRQEQGQQTSDPNTHFLLHVKKQWVHTQNDSQRQKNRHDNHPIFQANSDIAQPIQHDWRPSQDALQILQRSGVEPQFIEDAIPEFVLYWSERGDAHKTWNSKFLQHIRLQWARYSASVEHSNLPLPIPNNWQPAPDCFDILAMAHIDPQFAKARIAEFVLYWRDSGQVHNSWNSRFLQYIKQQWGRQLAQPERKADGQIPAEPDYSTAAASLQRLNDTDW